MTVCVRGIRSVAIDVCVLDEAAAFYESVWKLMPVARDEGARYFRGTCAHHHILSLHAAARPAIRRVVFDAADRDVVDAMHARVKACGARCGAPHELDLTGGGCRFGWQGPRARNVALAAGWVKPWP